jgi:hypothetical protein
MTAATSGRTAPEPVGSRRSPWSHAVKVCGTGLGLRVYRHRLFESSLPIAGTACDHSRPAMNPHNQAGRNAMYAEFGRRDPEPRWRQEMGVDWMRRYEAREAIPPAYTQVHRRAARGASRGGGVKTDPYKPATPTSNGGGHQRQPQFWRTVCEVCHEGPWLCTLQQWEDRYMLQCVTGCATCWGCGVPLDPEQRYPLLDGGETRLCCRDCFNKEPDERGNE